MASGANGSLAITFTETQAVGGGIDVWVGSTGATRPDAIICTVDLLKRDAEIKILIGCSESEQQTILAFHNGESMRALLVRRDER